MKNKKNILNIENIIKIILMVMFFMVSMIVTQVGAVPTHNKHIPVCPNEVNGTFRCSSRVIVDNNNKIMLVTPSVGPMIGGQPPYGPSDFLSAYNLNGRTNTNQIIAIIDAYDDPFITTDLATYSNQFGLPALGNCPVSSGTITSPCFQKVDQRGGTNFPIYNQGWAMEISLDVEIAHAICQNCNILLVEADNNSYANLMAAFDRAVSMKAGIISNSYSSGEFPSETSLDSHFNLPGRAITFSSGDGGYVAGPQYPAASPYVTSVGGTNLSLNPRTETVWNGAGSGCSAYESKPSFQKDTGCVRRTIADVSADADPNTGAAILDSGIGGWIQIGGTSLSAPIIASIYAQAGGFSGYGNQILYSNKNYGVNINDITTGSNGNCGTYICNAVSGYDGPTGLGTPKGIGAFNIPLSIISSYPASDPTTLNGTAQMFNITLNKSANVIWYMNNSQVKTDPNVNLSNYTNSSASIGTYNVTVSATDGIGTVTKIWNWTIICNAPWDVNGDGIVDIRDIVIVGQHFGQTTSPPYPRYDVNADGIVDIRDIVIVGQHLGQTTCWK